ncbi:MAG: tyrosine--tRNA ligase [Syntrophobacterales bacterium]|nr:tyrosine--tRNA ligase [Syntrophobacterales bacterium]
MEVFGVKNAYDTLLERGFIEQVTDDQNIQDLFMRERITCYIGFDPTAASLHIGSLVPIMALAHMQRHGNRPIVLIGGGTALIGDPSGKTEMRQVLTKEQVDENAQALKQQLSKYVDFDDDKALLLNNADWLTGLNYIEFLRDIGRHFSVNRMLAAESYKMRLEKGLNFIEFNYMLLQAYDFLYLNRHYDCTLQMGGNDQWGNMVAGIDLIRRLEGNTVYGITFPLIITSLGHKMGKTEKGTIWLDSKLTSPYDYFQYWINTDDKDVERFLALFTFLPMEEIAQAGELSGSQLNAAKSVLAFETTKITHGEQAAVSAWRASASASTFNLKPVDPALFKSSSIPRSEVIQDMSAIAVFEKTREEVVTISIPELFEETNLCASRGETRRLIAQGGIYVNERRIQSIDERITIDDIDQNGEIRLRKGKKKYARIRVG